MCYIESMAIQRRRTPPADYRDLFRRKNRLSPRMRTAIRLYATGLVPTKGAAALAAGLSKATFYQLTSPGMQDPQVSSLMGEVDLMVANEAIDTRRIIEILSRKSIGVLGKLMLHSPKEEIQLAAARDLADRGNETSKITKMQVESFTLSGKDAQGLAAAMVEAARVRNTHAALATQDFIKLDGGMPETPSD